MRIPSSGASLTGALLTWTLLPTWLAGGWDVRLPIAAAAGPPIAVDRRGNVLVALFIHGEPRAIRKLAVGDGSILWHRNLGEDRIGALAVSPAGPIFIAGRGIEGQSAYPGMLVERLSPRNGRTEWRRVIPGEDLLMARDWVFALAVDGRGDVVAAGARAGNPFAVSDEDFTVVKLAGDGGFMRWRFEPPDGPGSRSDRAGGAARSVVVDANDDIIAAGTTHASADGPPTATVVKLRGTDGRTFWRRDIAGPAGARSVAVDSADDILVAAETAHDAGPDFTVFKLSGTTGEVLWEFRLSRSPTEDEGALQVIALGSGDPVALGITTGPTGKRALTTARLGGGTGQLLWRRLMRTGFGGASLVALPDGDFVVGGGTRCGHVSVVHLSADTGRVLGRLRFRGASASRCGQAKEELGGIAADGRGRVVVSGSLNDRLNHGTGFVARPERLP